MFIVYSTGCPQCKILLQKIKEKTIPYEIIDDIKIMESKGILSVPVVEYNGKMYNYIDSLKLVRDW